MPTKKSKICTKQSGGWLWEQLDPVFGKANKWLATQTGYIDDDLKSSKPLSNAVQELEYGRRRPHGKHMQHGCGSPVLEPSNFNKLYL